MKKESDEKKATVYRDGSDLEARLNRAAAIAKAANPELWERLEKAETLEESIKAILEA